MFANVLPQYAKNIGSDISHQINSEPHKAFYYDSLLAFFVAEIRFNVEKNFREYDYQFMCDSFWDIIRDQVHIFPSLVVDFGLVLSQEEIDYYIWNAHTNQKVTVHEPVVDGDFGTTFILNKAGDFELDYGEGVGGLLTVFPEGPVSSFTDFYINVDVAGETITYVLKTSATRLIVFQLWADWNGKSEVTYKFETIVTSNSQNYEQRRPLLEKPQRILTFNHVDTTYGSVTNAINFAQDKVVGIPLVYESFPIAKIDSNKMSITANYDLSQLWNLQKYCEYIIITDRENILIVKEIADIIGNKISVSTPILDVIPNEDALVGFPMVNGYIKAANSKILSSNLVSWDLTFEELLGEGQPVLTGVPNLPTTFDFEFDWAKPINREQSLYRDIGGFVGTAQMLYSKFPKNKNNPKSYTGTITLKSKIEVISFLNFVCAAKGRLKKFEYLFPLNDFLIIQGEYQGASQLRVKTNNYAAQYSKVLSKKVVISYRGQKYTTQIVGASQTMDYIRLNLQNATPFQIFEEDCHNVRIEEWKTVRFDLDDFKLTPKSDSIYEVNVRLVEVYQ